MRSVRPHLFDNLVRDLMGELLESLHRLQALELKLAAIRIDRESKVRLLDACRKRLRLLDDRMAAHEKNLLEKQIELDSLSLDASAREESIASHRVALTKAKTNREYAAILTAMNTEKADNMKLENDVLQRIEDVQNLKDEKVALAAEREKLLADVDRAEKGLAAFDEERREQRTALEAKRDEHSQHVEPVAMASFLRVALKNEGEAMATVTRVHAKREDYVCGGCNMKISLEVVSALLSRDEIQFCDTCGRILYLEGQAPQRSRA